MTFQLGPTEDRKSAINALRQEGLTYEDIGTRLGVSRERVRQIVNGSQNGHRRDDESRKQAVFLRTADVAILLGIHANTVRRWANDGTLKSYRIGKRGDRRFRRDDIERVISEQGETGES